MRSWTGYGSRRCAVRTPMGRPSRSGPSAWAVVLLACCRGSTVTDGANDADDPHDTEHTDDSDTSPVTAALSGLRWELPCLSQTTPELCTTFDNLSDDATLAGGGTTYDVTLRIRGVIEPKSYDGGTEGDGWNQDGVPADDTANIYALLVTDPPATYYVNSGTTRLGTELYAEAIDFEMTIAAATGATVTLRAESLDALQIRNIDANGSPIVVPDIPPAPGAFDGQFVQMDVVSVQSR